MLVYPDTVQQDLQMLEMLMLLPWLSIKQVVQLAASGFNTEAGINKVSKAVPLHAMEAYGGEEV
jgi:hypothetical protein